MASQLQRVTRDPRLRVDQDAQLQARMRFLPQIMANKASKKIEAKRDAQFQQQFALEEDKYRLQKKRNKADLRTSEAMMGMEAAKFGTGMTFGPTQGQNVGQMIGNTGTGMFSGGSNTSKPGMIGGLNLTGLLSSGLTGFGVGRMIGGPKKKRSAGGAVAGGLMSLLSNKSNSLGGAAFNFGKGALLGGLGGIF